MLPLQCSGLENPTDGGASWAAVHGVAESDTTERLRFHLPKGMGFPYPEAGGESGCWSWTVAL